jgi:hypothetical protein
VLGLFLQRLGTWFALRGMDSMSGTVGFEELEEGGKKVSGVGWSYCESSADVRISEAMELAAIPGLVAGRPGMCHRVRPLHRVGPESRRSGVRTKPEPAHCATG